MRQYMCKTWIFQGGPLTEKNAYALKTPRVVYLYSHIPQSLPFPFSHESGNRHTHTDTQMHDVKTITTVADAGCNNITHSNYSEYQYME